jgi:DNA replication protein DnaC
MMTRNNNQSAPQEPVQQLQMLARSLNLITLAENLPRFLGQAEQNSIAYSEFTRKLLDAEVNARLDRKIIRILKQAKLGTVEDLDSFDFLLRPKLEARVVKELCTCQFVAEKRNILCLGQSGLGKTRIAKTIGRAACLAGYSVLFVNTAAMLEDLQGSIADGSFHRSMHRYTKPTLLICDEFGHEPFDNKATKYLFRLVSARHRQGSTILTSNTGFSKWKNFFPTEAAAFATVDRLVDGATILRFSGKGFREPKEIFGAPLEDD